MKFVKPLLFGLLAGSCSARAVRRDGGGNGFSQGEPINTQNGKGAPHSGKLGQFWADLY